MDRIKVSDGIYVSKGSRVLLTEDAKIRKSYGELTYIQLMNEMVSKKADYLLVSGIRKDKIICVKIPGDDTGVYDIYPMDLESINGPETPPAPPYNNKRLKRTRRNNRKRKTRRSSNRK